MYIDPAKLNINTKFSYKLIALTIVLNPKFIFYNDNIFYLFIYFKFYNIIFISLMPNIICLINIYIKSKTFS